MIPFLDLAAQTASVRTALNEAMDDVLDRGAFTLGPAVAHFEKEFAAYCGVSDFVGVNSGASALHLALLAAGIGPGDEVITTPMTFIATVAAIRYVGATPVFADIDPVTWNLDPHQVAKVITPRTRALLPVHLHGRVADMTALDALARQHGLILIEDAAQAHGARHFDRRAGSFGALACFSFYPGKNLGACGEGGGVATHDPLLAEKIRQMRDWGQDRKYHHVLPGFNYRMGGFQGACLGVKLPLLDAWNEGRRQVAGWYRQRLQGLELILPEEDPRHQHVYHVFAVLVPDRDRVQQVLTQKGIGTNLHYPVPVHLQPVFADLGHARGDFPISEAVGDHTLSLPMFPELRPEQVDEVGVALTVALADRQQEWPSCLRPR